MSRPTVEVSALPVGWSRLSGSGIHLLLSRPLDDPLVARLRATLPSDRVPGCDPLDDVLDVLLLAGVRELPEFVAVDEVDPVRLVLRGASVVEVTVDGEVRAIAAGGARTWTDVEVTGNVELVSLRLSSSSVTPRLTVAPLLVAPLVARQVDDHEELPSYDHLFGSTQRGTEPPPVLLPPPWEASELTLRPPTESCAVPGGSRVVPGPPPAPAPPAPTQPAPTPPAPGQPKLGILRLDTGEVVSLDRGVLLGRAPTVEGDATAPERPHVLRLASPDNDISRNHAEVLLREGHVMVRDLGSANGTTVALPGQEPMRLHPNEQQVIEPGTVVALADEVSFTYELEP